MDKNKKNDDSGQLLLASLDKLPKEKNETMIKLANMQYLSIQRKTTMNAVIKKKKDPAPDKHQQSKVF